MCLFSLFTIYNSDDSTTNSEQSWPDEYEPGKPVESAWTSHSDSQGQVRAFLSFPKKSLIFSRLNREGDLIGLVQYLISTSSALGCLIHFSRIRYQSYKYLPYMTGSEIQFPLKLKVILRFYISYI